jgi:hypothetical protein
MDWQTPAAVLAVALAAAYTARQALRAWRGKSAGCGTCKCSAPEGRRQSTSLIAVEDLTRQIRGRG